MEAVTWWLIAGLLTAAWLALRASDPVRRADRRLRAAQAAIAEEELNRQFSCEHGVPADTRCDLGCDDSRWWQCPWVLPVGYSDGRTVHAICVNPEPHGDADEHLAVVESGPVLFGPDLGEKQEDLA